MRRRVLVVLTTLALGGPLLAVPAGPAVAAPADLADLADLARSAPSAPSAPAARATPPPKRAVAIGRGGGVTSVDADASRIGLAVLRRGGNAVDAAVATAAALGVTEPYSAGVGGGGYLVFYNARTGRVRTIDGRETAPSAIPRDAFIDPATGEPYTFTPDLVTSGVSVGVPGTPDTWRTALRRWGTRSLAQVLEPSARLAERGFIVDDTFRSQTADNEERFSAIRTTRRLFLRGGELPRVGSRFRNPALARTYRALGRNPALFRRGALPREISRTVQRPPAVPGTTLPVPRGYLRPRDFRRYQARVQAPTRTAYRGLEVVGMGPSGSGGTTVGEALNILEPSGLRGLDDGAYLHQYLEASALAFADRGAYLGDPRFVDVPVRDLLSQRYADERRCLLDPARASTKPLEAGDVTAYDGRCGTPSGRSTSPEDHENVSTTHLTVADRWGNVVAYTLTIEQTGGSGIVVPGRGFLLNNELTDFSLTYDATDPNRLAPGKRPRSSMSPTIVLRGGRPVLAVGSPGGSTIITTVLQVLLNRLERGMTLRQAVAAPRASQRNTATVSAEPGFIDRYGALLEGTYGHDLVPSGDAFTSAAEIGAVTAIEIGRRGRLTVVAEPTRRGGGSARVLRPAGRR
ncbi:gamma-glutamyltransferase [Nocardioides litoris]|uniref:gamma-glutamyltransferase n=1 Tax=Nocardioides litoris TaxID=1926648 RepID=UPI00111CB2C2|nr:gamma-glutamyltransferase [Nocardioides litoris]